MREKVYCNNINCKVAGCIRSIENAPFEEAISVDRFYPNSENQCKGFSNDWESTELYDHNQEVSRMIKTVL